MTERLPTFTNDDRSPYPGRAAFICPHCEAYSAQITSDSIWVKRSTNGSLSQLPGSWPVTICVSCQQPAFWRATEMLYPVAGVLGPAAPADLLEPSLAIYEEARHVGNVSPRSAAALLRLCLEEVVNEIETGSGSLNDKVGKLVQRGLPEAAQRAMDVLRVFGNNGAHVGEIDLTDDRDTVLALFQVLHVVVDHVITRAKQIDDLWSRIPETKKAAIERRDS